MKNGHKDGVQLYKCQCCNKYYRIDSTKGYSEETKELAIKAYYSGMSGRAVGKMFGMSKANVYNWIKKRETVWISPETETAVFEMDELFWSIKRKERIKTKENMYIIPLISRKPQ